MFMVVFDFHISPTLSSLRLQSEELFALTDNISIITPHSGGMVVSTLVFRLLRQWFNSHSEH